MKAILFSIALFLTCLTQAQPFISVSGTTKGIAFSAGLLTTSGLEVSAGYNMWSRTPSVPTIGYVQAGYHVLLSQNEKDNYTLTPGVGVASWSRKDFTEWDKGGDVISISKVALLLSLEAGKDINLGRVFINVSYCERPYAGVGIRAFFR